MLQEIFVVGITWIVIACLTVAMIRKQGKLYHYLNDKKNFDCEFERLTILEYAVYRRALDAVELILEW